MNEGLDNQAREQSIVSRRTRTLYVREEDQVLWDRAKELIGERSLSAYLTEHLRATVASREAAARGFDRILLSFRQRGIPKNIAFYGRWVVSPELAFAYGDDRFAVALSAKGKVVIFEFRGMSESGKFDRGELMYFDSFEEANQQPYVPPGLVAQAMEILGVQVQELDI